MGRMEAVALGRDRDSDLLLAAARHLAPALVQFQLPESRSSGPCSQMDATSGEGEVAEAVGALGEALDVGFVIDASVPVFAAPEHRLEWLGLLPPPSTAAGPDEDNPIIGPEERQSLESVLALLTPDLSLL